MLNKIKSITFSFKYLYSATLIFIGTFLISSSILKNDLFHLKKLFFNNEFNYDELYRDKFIHYNSYKKNSLAKIDKQPKLTKKSDIDLMLTLPQDLHLIKNVKLKKEKFINSLLPLIVAVNQKILLDRSRIIKIQNYLNTNKTLTKIDQRFIINIADKYLIETKNRHKIDIINDLLEHVDIIPNSIVLAQAANESGWGSSRFAREFNALFGQYTYDANNGIEPSSREDDEKHLIKFFPSINHCIDSYFHNINTHFAYYNFRQARKYLRENNQPFDPNILSKKLNTYAEDKSYIHTIISIIRFNKLTEYDMMI